MEVVGDLVMVLKNLGVLILIIKRLIFSLKLMLLMLIENDMVYFVMNIKFIF